MRIQQVKLQNVAWLMGSLSLIHTTRKFFWLSLQMPTPTPVKNPFY